MEYCARYGFISNDSDVALLGEQWILSQHSARIRLGTRLPNGDLINYHGGSLAEKIETVASRKTIWNFKDEV